MTIVGVGNFTISIDGFGAGPAQSLDQPLGRGAEELHSWFLSTRSFNRIHGEDKGTGGIDDEIGARPFENLGAVIMGRNMFGPVRGAWPGVEWNGWWGDNPPFHVPVLVLTHHPRQPVEMEGGTTFHFVTDGIRSALDRAVDAAAGKKVLIGGGVSTIRQYLEAGLIDELHIAVAPVLLGSGESLFGGLDLLSLGYRVVGYQPGEAALHIFIAKPA